MLQKGLFVLFFYFKGTIQSNTVINACDLINGGWKRHDSFPRVIIALNQSIDLWYIRVG